MAVQRRTSTVETIIGVAAFGLFLVLWIGFGVALVASQGSLDATWQWIQSQHIVVQGVLWLLFLPVMAGLWVWETTWPLILRLALVAGLACINLYLFFPRATSVIRP
jgi:hypothetical protein